MDDYEDGIQRLILEVKRLRASDWSPTPDKKELKKVEAQIELLHDWLDELGHLQEEIEREHDHREGDGNFKSVLSGLRSLKESTSCYADSLPNPRERPEISFAALALLHLRWHYWPERVKFSNTGPDVLELQRVCEAAGIFLGPDSYRKALTKADKKFNRYMRSFHITEILGF